MRFRLKELLILIYLATGAGAVAERIGSLGFSPELLLYAGLYGVLAASLFLAARVANPFLRCFYALILFAAAFFDQAVERITGDILSYDSFLNLLYSIGFADDALAQHGRSIALALLAGLPLLAGVALPPRWTPPGRRRGRILAGAAPLFATLLLAAMLFARGGDGTRGLPSAFPPLAYAAIHLYENVTTPSARAREVAIPRQDMMPGDIVLIVDESIGANYLDIDMKGGVRSGLAEPRPGIELFNYGFAASITNCSVGTNVTLRHGGTRAAYETINATMPTIWDYARKAGLRTVYIDAQRTGGQLQNLMSEQEKEGLDAFIQFDAVAVRDRDQAVADALAGLLGNRTAEIILVNKMGAHFPVHDKYPDSFLRYRPALPRGAYGGISDTGSRAGFGGGSEDWLLYRNAYRNTLLWNVGAFFDRLFAKADLSRATLIYTSDHGQDLHERGTTGLDTHCSQQPVAEEGLVPLVVIRGAGQRGPDWSRNLAWNRNRVSHYQIFPTLLTLMGYDPAGVRATYGESLADRSADDLSFNSRFNARLGLKPLWRRIDPSRIAAPPPDRGPESPEAAPPT